MGPECRRAGTGGRPVPDERRISDARARNEAQVRTRAHGHGTRGGMSGSGRGGSGTMSPPWLSDPRPVLTHPWRSPSSRRYTSAGIPVDRGRQGMLVCNRAVHRHHPRSSYSPTTPHHARHRECRRPSSPRPPIWRKRTLTFGGSFATPSFPLARAFCRDALMNDSVSPATARRRFTRSLTPRKQASPFNLRREPLHVSPHETVEFVMRSSWTMTVILCVECAQSM